MEDHVPAAIFSVVEFHGYLSWRLDPQWLGLFPSVSVIITDFFILFPLGAMSSFVARELFPKPVEGGSVLAMDILAKKFREQSLEESANQNASQIKFVSIARKIVMD